MTGIRRSLLAGGAFLSVAALLVGCASTDPGTNTAGEGQTQEGVSEYGTGDITPFCPESEAKVAYAKPSDNTWTKTVLAEIRDEASKCKTITDVIFANAQGDQQKAVSDVQSLVAQNVAAIVVQPDFGAAQVPSIAAANAAGVGTIPLISDPNGQVGADYSTIVRYDYDYVGKSQVAWLDKVLGGKGTVVFLGGTPGAASSKSTFDGVVKAMKEYPGLKLVEERVVDTNWDPGEKRRVMSGLLAQHGRIDAVITDYGAIDSSVMEAYLDAGLELPALATQASGNATGCTWEKNKFDYFSLDGSTSLGRIALRHALAVTKGVSNPEPADGIQLPVFIDTADGKNPTCQPDLPGDADLSTSLPLDQLKKLLG
jgi:ribose transport system substrate-binding protein